MGTPFIEDKSSARAVYISDFSVGSSNRPYIFKINSGGNGEFLNYSVLSWTGTAWQDLGGCGYYTTEAQGGSVHFELISNKPTMVCQKTNIYPNRENTLGIFRWNGSSWTKAITTINYKADDYGLLHGAQGGGKLYLANPKPDGKILVNVLQNGRLEPFSTSISGYQATIATSPTTGPVVTYSLNEKVYIRRWQ